ncbi:uncharacterized protein VTP21DRAFT_10305 [Calcarisporiella thermophila]|uniref:uncharacterized protein n=1 Tax=Calcarisporiella thermophila TaxID=911321 RepID=UPI0037446975
MADPWDDSKLIAAWEAAVKEYQLYHSGSKPPVPTKPPKMKGKKKLPSEAEAEFDEGELQEEIGFQNNIDSPETGNERENDEKEDAEVHENNKPKSHKPKPGRRTKNKEDTTQDPIQQYQYSWGWPYTNYPYPPADGYTPSSSQLQQPQLPQQLQQPQQPTDASGAGYPPDTRYNAYPPYPFSHYQGFPHPPPPPTHLPSHPPPHPHPMFGTHNAGAMGWGPRLQMPAPTMPMSMPIPIPTPMNSQALNSNIPTPSANGIDNENLANLLMAWYFAGYYTGLFQANRPGQQ